MNKSEHLKELNYGPKDAPSPDELKKRWRELCRKHHPDHGGNQEDFLRVTHAYKMLTDPSYAEKQGPELRKTDLNINIQYVMEFMDAFNGKRAAMTYSIITFDESGEPQVTKEEVETITHIHKFPPGSYREDSIVVEGKGHKMGDKRGALVIHPAVKKHPKFTCKPLAFGRWEIHSTEQIPLNILLSGGRVQVETMKGKKKLFIKPGTTPGMGIKVRGCGCNGADHVVNVVAKFPNQQELRDDYEGLKINWELEMEAEEEDERYEKSFREVLDSLEYQYFGRSKGYGQTK